MLEGAECRKETAFHYGDITKNRKHREKTAETTHFAMTAFTARLADKINGGKLARGASNDRIC